MTRTSGLLLAIARWTLPLLCVLVAMAFTFSLRNFVDWTSQDAQHGILLCSGKLWFARRPEGWRPSDDQGPTRPGWSFGGVNGRLGFSAEWAFERSANRSWVSLGIPLWVPGSLAALLAVIAWYCDRRRVRASLHRWKTWLTPAGPRRLQLLLIVGFSLLHLLSLFGRSR